MPLRKGNYDPKPLMHQLAAMANMEFARIRRMVLVLDVDELPQLYVQAFLQEPEEGKTPELVPTELAVEEGPYYLDTTSMQNKDWRTKEPPPCGVVIRGEVCTLPAGHTRGHNCIRGD